MSDNLRFSIAPRRSGAQRTRSLAPLGRTAFDRHTHSAGHFQRVNQRSRPHPRSFLMKTMLTRGCAIVLLAAAPLAAQSGGRAFQPEDWYKIARVGGGTLS